MEKTIVHKLNEIEEREEVQILYAVESGSRAWGFESKDSDYDVRFIYLRPLSHYIKLEKVRDVIELPIDDVLDINGWDLQKALRLLHSSNPTLFEWANSPIVYKTTCFFEELKEVFGEYFKAKAGLYHYLNTAHNNYRGYLKGDTVKVKKYFYVLRPILACKWILKENTPPPMLFSDLMDVLDESLKPIVFDLLEKKRTLPEMGEMPLIAPLNDYIETNLAELKAIIDALPKSEENSYEKLNHLFLSALGI